MSITLSNEFLTIYHDEMKRLALNPDTSRSANARYKYRASLFKSRYGLLAPGESVPSGEPEDFTERRALWDAWRDSGQAELDIMNAGMSSEDRTSSELTSKIKGATMVPIEQILDNRRSWRLCWHEPMPALTNGTERTANRIVSMMVHDAIDVQRFVAAEKPNNGLDDHTLLQDFMAVNCAWIVQDTGDHDAVPS